MRIRLILGCGLILLVNGYGGEYTLHSDFAELKLWLYAKLAWKVSEVSEEYVWYELPEWTPREDDVFFVMRGTCDAWAKNFTPKDVPDAVWIDCVEISRVSPVPFSVRP